MKKKTILVLLALLLALTMTVLLVACNDNPGPVDPTDQDPCKNGHVEDDGEVTVQPTCQTKGTRTYRCKVCGEVVRTEPVDKTDHVWDNGTQTQAPGCGTVGKMTFHCTVEGCNETKTEDIPATGVHTKGTWVPEEPATCKKEGTHDYYQCTNCSAKLDEDGNEYDADDLVIPKAAHTWDNGVVTPATCEEEGHITYTCEVCSTTSTQTIPANGHTYGELIPQQDATCEHTGEEAHYMCSVCGKLFDEAKEQVEKTDLEIGLAKHTLDEVTGKPATCTEDGFETYYKCSVCNKLFADDKAETPIEQPKTLTATGHKPIPYGDKAATCTEAGYANGKICSECGTVIVQPKRVAPLGHAYVYTPVGDGVHHTVTCSRNNDYHETELCASIGRWMSDNAEYHYHKCDKCKYECDIANHTFQDKKCTVCGAVQSDVIVRVEGQLDHIENSVAAAIEYIKQNYNDGTPVTIIIGANYTANVTFDGNINVTLDLGGFGIGMSTFSLVVDGQADVTLTNGTLAGKVQFNGGKLVLDGVGGSYTIALKSGLKCDKADVTVNGASLDHAWNNGQVTTPPTCEGTGTRTYTCTRCQATRTEDEPAKGHTYGTLIPQQDPTCTATGTAAHYQCADCHKLFVDENGSKKEVQADELVLDKIEHTYGKLIPQQDATCVADGHKAYFQCEVCKQYFDEEKQPAEWKDLVLTSDGHDFDTTEWKYDGTNHWYECKNDSTHHDQQAPHSWDYRKGENGSHEHYCTVCGYVDKTDATCTPAAPAPADSHDENHGLNIQDGWYADADYHWQICKDCGATINRNTHVWVGDEGSQCCQTCGHKFFDVKISDGEKLDQSAPTIAKAFDWITAHGDKTKTYTVTLTHNRSDDSTNTVTVPEGYKVVLVLGDYSVTYTNGKLSVGKGSELTVQGNGEFVIGTIEYSGGKLVLPDGEYNFEIKGGYTCLTADITVGEKTGLEHKYTFVWDSNSKHHEHCSVCGNDKASVAHTRGEDIAYVGDWQHSYTCADCGKTVTSNCEPELNVCECGHTFTVDEIIEKLKATPAGQKLSGTYEISGIVDEVHATRGQYFILQGTTEQLRIQSYGTKDSSQYKVKDIVVGATVTIRGTLENYDGGNFTSYEVNGGTLVGLVTNYAITYNFTNENASELADVNPAPANAKIGTDVTFKVNVKATGWYVSIVKVNEQVVSPNADGSYTFKMEKATTVEITLINEAEIPYEEQSVTYDSTQQKFSSGTAVTVGNASNNSGASFSVSFDGGGNRSTPKYYIEDGKGDGIRLYGNNNFTVTCPANYIIVKIVLQFAQYNDGDKVVTATDNAVKHGVYSEEGSPKTGTWKGSAQEVKFTVENGSGHRRLVSITVYLMPVCHHLNIVPVEQKPATCTESGYEAHFKCERCGQLFSDVNGNTKIDEPIVIPAKGHEYTATGEWAPDHSSVTITLTCSKCNDTEKNHTVTITQNIDITTQVTQEQTCVKQEITKYTAKVSYNGKDYTVEESAVTKDAAGHTWTEPYTHDGIDGNTKTHTKTCSVCGETEQEACTGLTVGSDVDNHWDECPGCHFHYNEKPHEFDSDGNCEKEGCPIKSQNVSVTINGDETKYRSLADAFVVIDTDTTATVKLLSSCTEEVLALPNKGNVTLDFGEQTLTVTSDMVVSGGSLTVTNGTLQATIKVTSTSAKLTIDSTVTGYTLKLEGDGVTCDVAQVTINGAHIQHSDSYTQKQQDGVVVGHTYQCVYCGRTGETLHAQMIADKDGNYIVTAEAGNHATHHEECELCEYSADVNHSYSAYRKKDDAQHSRTCSVCEHEQAVDHDWSEKATDNGDGQHKRTCTEDGCDAEKLEGHTLQRRKLTVGGEITQDMADHQHEVSCSECDYVVRENHDFGTGSKDQRHDCLCGEKLCQYGEETAHVSGTISPKESDDSNYLFPVSTDTTKSNYVDGENKLIGGITFAYNQLAHAFYNKTADVIQMKKAQDSKPAGYLYNTGAITGGVKSITITISHEKDHTGGSVTGSTIIKNSNYKVLIISFGYDTDCKELEVDVLVNEETDPQFTWTDTEGKNYTYFKISHAHANSNAVCIKSIDINYSIQEGHHVVDDWIVTPNVDEPCRLNGTRTGTCIRCGETVTEEAPAQGHKWEWQPATSATCTEPAYVGQWYCSVCHKYIDDYTEGRTPYLFEDSDLMSQERIVDKNQNNGQPLGHNLVWEHDTDGHTGEHRQYCTRGNCGHVEVEWTKHTIGYKDITNDTHTPYCKDGCGWVGKATGHVYDGDDGACVCTHREGVKTFSVGEASYDKLSEALEAVASSGGTIVLNNTYEVTEDDLSEVFLFADVTISTGTFKLTVSIQFVVMIEGKLTLQGDFAFAQGFTLGDGELLIDSGAVVAGNVVLTGGTTTIQGAVNGSVEVSEGTLKLNGATITGNITLTVGSAGVYFEDEGSSTITGTVTITTTSENAKNLLATFEQEQTAYKLKVEGVTCDELSDGVAFGEKSTPISHTYSEKNATQHECGICLHSENHNWEAVVLTEGWNDETHDTVCVDCGATGTAPHNSDGENGNCTCGKQAAKSWKLVTDVKSLSDEDQIIIVACDYDVALGADNGNNRKEAKITRDTTNKTVSFEESAGVQIITVIMYSSKIAFRVGTNTYLYAAGGTKSNNYLKQITYTDVSSIEDKAFWSISITSTGTATIKTLDSSVVRHTIMYNDNAKLFSCYASGQKNVSIYKLS